MTEVKFCENNFTHGTENVVKKLKKEHPDISLLVESCVDHCDECKEGPFALVNGSFIKADSADDLYSKILEKL